MSQSYLSGVKESEDMVQSGYSFTEMQNFIEDETLLCGDNWCRWVEGFKDGLEHFRGLKTLNLNTNRGGLL